MKTVVGKFFNPGGIIAFWESYKVYMGIQSEYIMFITEQFFMTYIQLTRFQLHISFLTSLGASHMSIFN